MVDVTTKVEWDSGGVMDFMKSDAVASFLGEKAAEIASEATEAVDAHLRLHSDHLQNEHVMGTSKVLDRTSVGVVYTANQAAANVVARHPEIFKNAAASGGFSI